MEKLVRTPIKGLRKPIMLNNLEELKWDDLYEKLNNYIKYASKSVNSQSLSSTVISSEDLYQEGLLLLYTCFEKYKYKPMEEFTYIYKASMWRMMRNTAYKPTLGCSSLDNLDENYDIGYEDIEVENIYEEFKLQQVVELIGDNQIALNILKEIINPSDRTVWESDMDMARKATIKSQGNKINVPRNIDTRGTFIQRSLNLTHKSYQENIRLIQDYVYKIYSTDTTISKYDPYDELLTPEEYSNVLNDIKTTYNRIKEYKELSVEECCNILSDIKKLLTA